MRLACTRTDCSPENADVMLIAVDGEYGHIVDRKGHIWHIRTNNLRVKVDRAFSNAVTAAVKP